MCVPFNAGNAESRHQQTSTKYYVTGPATARYGKLHVPTCLHKYFHNCICPFTITLAGSSCRSMDASKLPGHLSHQMTHCSAHLRPLLAHPVPQIPEHSLVREHWLSIGTLSIRNGKIGSELVSPTYYLRARISCNTMPSDHADGTTRCDNGEILSCYSQELYIPKLLPQ